MPEVTPPASAPGLPRSARRILAATAAALVAAVALLVGLDLDLSPQRYLRNDVLFRGADSVQELYRYPTMDPSPFSVALPTNAFVHRSLRAGELPLWDRRQGGGYSPWVQGNQGVLYPLRWLVALLPEGQAASALLLATFAGAFAACFLLLVELGLGPSAACLGAGAFVLSGSMVSNLLFDGVAVYLFLPWLLLAYLRWRRRPDLPRFAHCALAFGLGFTAGHHMLLASVFLAVAIAVAADALLHHRNPRLLLGFGAAGVVGAGLAAVVLLPFALHATGAWQYKTQSDHGLSYVVPELSGWLEQLRLLAFEAETPFLDSDAFVLHLGLALLGLALLGAIVAWRRRERRFLAVTLAATFLIGIPGPWMGFLGALPPIGWIRVLYLHGTFAFASALAIAMGFDALRRFDRVRVPAALFPIAVVVLLLGPALGAVRVFTPAAAESIPESRPFRFLQADDDAFRITALWGQSHLPNIASMTGLEDLRIVTVAMNPRYHAWFQVVDPDVLAKSYPTSRVTNELGSPLVGAFNVKYVLQGRLPHHVFTTQVAPDDPFGVYPPGAFQISPASLATAYEDRFVRIFRLEDGYRGRIFFPDAVEVIEPGIERARSWLRANAGRLPGTALVEVASAELRQRLAAAPLRSDAEWTLRYPSNHRVEIRVRTPDPALLVLNDLYEAGWTASVDGEARDIVPVNLVSRGVFLEAGEHEVEMDYRPPGLVAGALLSGVCGAGLLAGLVWQRQRTGSSIGSPNPPMQ